MCRPASFIIVKGPKALWSKTDDSHSGIRREFGLPDTGLRPVNVQVEITPPDGDFAAPFAAWRFRVDQDMLPGWWDAMDAADAEAETRRGLEAWARTRLVRAGETRDVRDGELVTAVLRGGTVDAVRGGTVDAVLGGTVNVVRGGTINVVRGGTVDVVRGGTVDVVRGGTVDAVLGGTVNAVLGGTVCFLDRFVTKLNGVQTVVIDRSGTTARCFVGRDLPRDIASTDPDSNL